MQRSDPRAPWLGVPELRRRIMRANPHRNTGPERILRSQLHRAGYRFRVDHRLDLPGGRVRPDIVFTRSRVAVFVDGCFWHGCPTHGSTPKTRPEYWVPKIAATKERDALADKRLDDAGWAVVRIWEHESPEDAVGRVLAAIRRQIKARASHPRDA